jgi:hypothetical protein
MQTMTTSQSAIDDVLDSRAMIRTLEKELLKRRIEFRAAKEKLADARARLEENLTQLEQRQGRLPFPEADQTDAPAPAARPSNGRGGKRVAAAAGQSSWKETR